MQMHLYVPVEEAQLLEILSTLSKSRQIGPIAEKSHLFETSRHQIGMTSAHLWAQISLLW